MFTNYLLWVREHSNLQADSSSFTWIDPSLPLRTQRPPRVRMKYIAVQSLACCYRKKIISDWQVGYEAGLCYQHEVDYFSPEHSREHLLDYRNSNWLLLCFVKTPFNQSASWNPERFAMKWMDSQLSNPASVYGVNNILHKWRICIKQTDEKSPHEYSPEVRGADD